MENTDRRETILDLFEKFLLDNDCYSQFYSNVIGYLNITIEEYIRIFRFDSSQLIHNAFWWEDSPEGFHYWNRLDSLWKSLLASKIF